MRRHDWKRFLIENSSLDYNKRVELDSDSLRKLKAFCKKHFVFSGSDNNKSFLVDTGKLYLYRVDFFADSVTVRSFIK